MKELTQAEAIAQRYLDNNLRRDLVEYLFKKEVGRLKQNEKYSKDLRTEDMIREDIEQNLWRIFTPTHKE
jgi:hypothetical protein